MHLVRYEALPSFNFSISIRGIQTPLESPRLVLLPGCNDHNRSFSRRRPHRLMNTVSMSRRPFQVFQSCLSRPKVPGASQAVASSRWTCHVDRALGLWSQQHDNLRMTGEGRKARGESRATSVGLSGSLK